MRKKTVLLFLALAALLLALPVRAGGDLVVLKNGVRYNCKVVEDDPDSDHILVRITYEGGKTGVISIPRKNIVRIEYDYESRKARLKPDDYAGRYDLARFCMDHGLYDEALAELEAAAGKKGVPDDAFLMLASLYEHKGMKMKALAAYIEYYNRHPNDEEVYEKILELKKSLAPPKPTASPAPKPSGAPPKPTPRPSLTPRITVIEGLEAKPNWTVAPWAGPGAVAVKRIGGNRVVEFLYDDPGASQKAACYLLLADPVDRKAVERLELKALNSAEHPVQVALAFWVGRSLQDGEYYEAKPLLLPPGKWTPLSFEIGGKWKRQPKWTYTEALPNEKIWVVFLLVYPGRNEGEIKFDEIVFSTGKK